MLNSFTMPTQKIGWGLIALFIVADYLFVVLANLLFASGVLMPVQQATAGLVNRTLMANLPILLIVVVFGMMRLGKLKPADLGLVRRKILPALVFTAGLWLLVQVVLATLGLAVNGAITINQTWWQPGALAIIGVLLGHIFGNALYEDIAYRAFLLPQVWLNISKPFQPQRSKLFVAALIVSQLLFALRHIPGRLLMGLTSIDMVFDLLLVMVIGIIYALIYIRTNNLFMVIGAHVLTNVPLPLFSTALIAPDLLAPLLSLMIVLLWPVFTRKKEIHAPLEALRPS